LSPRVVGCIVIPMVRSKWRHGQREDLVASLPHESVKEVRWRKRDRRANQDRSRLSKLFGPQRG
jgi:hypothetical protein